MGQVSTSIKINLNVKGKFTMGKKTEQEVKAIAKEVEETQKKNIGCAIVGILSIVATALALVFIACALDDEEV